MSCGAAEVSGELMLLAQQASPRCQPILLTREQEWESWATSFAASLLAWVHKRGKFAAGCASCEASSTREWHRDGVEEVRTGLREGRGIP